MLAVASPKPCSLGAKQALLSIPVPPTLKSTPQPTSFVNPNLTITTDSTKGRKVVALAPIKDGEALLVDTPYALVPAMNEDEPPFQLCSNHQCNLRLTPQQSSTTKGIKCPRGCAVEVIWCSESCYQRDQPRHERECLWLGSVAKTIRASTDDSMFGLLWLIFRIMLSKHFDSKQCLSTTSTGGQTKVNAMSPRHFQHQGWDAVWNLEGSVDSFPSSKVASWRELITTFIMPGLNGITTSIEEVTNLVCKVELNSFGLYPGVTGEYPVTSYVSRGGYYGGGIYPTAAMLNHACCPNVTHRVDAHGRRIFETNRAIAAGEECCISYFDLVEYMDTKIRREEIRKSWSFTCCCDRCENEGEYSLPHFLLAVDWD